MKVLFIGGTFDDNGGRPSSVVEKFKSAFISLNDTEFAVDCYNGGYYEELESLLQKSTDMDVVLWWANVPNDKPKMRDVKSVNPKTLLVTSKRNDNGKYKLSELINRALTIKANLFVEFSKKEEKFEMRLLDPLGNQWYKGVDIGECARILINRIKVLAKVTRQGTVRVEGEAAPIVPNEVKFFDLIKDYAEVFHKLVNPDKNVTRFLGNSSFRCQRGFPSFKKDGIVYVSQRNVDKRFIDKEAFVPTKLIDGKVFYYGERKPSVDTPIQLRLYNELPNINYMIHAHVYIEDAPFTNVMIPCGGLQEVDEVMSVIKAQYKSSNLDFYAINMIGHGCIVMADSVEKLKGLKYVSRKMPEVIK